MSEFEFRLLRFYWMKGGYFRFVLFELMTVDVGFELAVLTMQRDERGFSMVLFERG